MIKRTLFGILIAFALAQTSAWAHLNSVSFSTIKLSTQAVQIELRSTVICVLELFPVDKNGDQILAEEEVAPYRQVMYFYLSNKIKVLSGGAQLKMSMRDITFEEGDGESYLVYDLWYKRRDPSQPVIIINNIQEETDPYHRNLSVIEKDGREHLFVFTQENYLNTSDPSALTPIRQSAPAARGPDSISSSTGTVSSASSSAPANP